MGWTVCGFGGGPFDWPTPPRLRLTTNYPTTPIKQALAILQSPTPDCLWAEAQALLDPAAATDHPPRLIDVSSLLWALAALQFPPECPPALLEGLLGALKPLLLAVAGAGTGKRGGVVDKQAASQVGW